MVFFLVLCAIAAVILIALGIRTDLHELWANPNHHALAGGPHTADRARPDERHRL